MSNVVNRHGAMDPRNLQQVACLGVARRCCLTRVVAQNMSQMASMINPQVLQQLGGMGGLTEMMKQLGGDDMLKQMMGGMGRGVAMRGRGRR